MVNTSKNGHIQKMDNFIIEHLTFLNTLNTSIKWTPIKVNKPLPAEHFMLLKHIQVEHFYQVYAFINHCLLKLNTYIR